MRVILLAMVAATAGSASVILYPSTTDYQLSINQLFSNLPGRTSNLDELLAGMDIFLAVQGSGLHAWKTVIGKELSNEIEFPETVDLRALDVLRDYKEFLWWSVVHHRPIPFVWDPCWDNEHDQPPSVVPEPRTFAYLALGLITFAVLRCLRRKVRWCPKFTSGAGPPEA